MQARDVMTTAVVTIEAEAPITEAIRLMLHNRISGLPVVNAAGTLVGVVTEGDFLRRTETGTEVQRPNWLEFLLGPGRLAADYVRSHGRKVAEIMTTEVVTVDEETEVAEIVRLMERRRIKRVPVLRDGKVVGIVSRANLLRALAGIMADVPPVLASDKAVRERILAELKAQKWAPRANLDITVRNGVVELWGTILDERERPAIRVIAENVPGVKAVEDHLYWIGPFPEMIVEAPQEQRDRPAKVDN